MGIIFTLAYVLNWLVDVVIGQRVAAATELAGLDLPEMGALGYPEFQLVSAGLGRSLEVAND
jgi:Amt family ammonium transporter